MSRGGLSAIDLPPEPYVPGRTARPDEGVFDDLKAVLAPGVSVEWLVASRAYRAGHEAFQRGYFWEAHELWEAVWMCLPPASAERHLLRGLIQFANAGLKVRMGKKGAVERILSLAGKAVREAYLHRPDAVMGMTRGETEAMGNRGRDGASENDAK